MGFIRRQWSCGSEAGITGWDPDSSLTFWSEIACATGVVPAVVFEEWSTGLGLVLLLVGIATGARYRLTVRPTGYRLTRVWLWVIPWRVRTYSREAVITTEDDWGDDIALKIHEVNEDYDQGIIFGTSRDCVRLAWEIRMLAFQVGCCSTEPGAIIRTTADRRGRLIRRIQHDETQ